jgi:hypothetical protein
VTLALALLTAFGLALVLAASVWILAGAPTRRLDPEEAARFGSGRSGVPTRFVGGKAAGVERSDQIDFAELKRGLADGSWRRSARLQKFLLLVAGIAIALPSLALLIGWQTRPLGLLVAVAVIAYSARPIVQGFRRA